MPVVNRIDPTIAPARTAVEGDFFTSDDEATTENDLEERVGYADDDVRKVVGVPAVSYAPGDTPIITFPMGVGEAFELDVKDPALVTDAVAVVIKPLSKLLAMTSPTVDGLLPS